jgi:phosphomannomutase
VSIDVQDLLAQARQWASEDPDVETRQLLTDTVGAAENGDTDALAHLHERFDGRLSFGTAGIRGQLGFGPLGMNRVVVSQTTAGLARYLLAHHHNPSQPIRVLVGYDARKNSQVFATDTAEVLSGHGIEVLLTPTVVPTPIVAFGVRDLHCDAGVMVTASHNPARDNGYKVYFGGADEGSQIIPPTDSEIEQHILSVARELTYREIPRNHDLVQHTPLDLGEHYSAATIAALAPTSQPTSTLTTVYTAMHGVGGETFLSVLASAGFARPELVLEQFEPDPTFPTVAFPNPEEKGALDMACARAQEVGAALIIAHDPDADRLAIALPEATSPNGYRSLTGNQVGAILGWRAASLAHHAGTGGTLANSIVSSPVLGAIARHFSLNHVETLTGFKYVSRVSGLIFGFEEALGYLVDPDVVRDKDGISAALAILDIAENQAQKGASLWDYLSTIEQAVGSFASGQITIATSTSSVATPLTDTLRFAPPRAIGHRGVEKYDDFLTGIDAFPRDNILRFSLDDGSRIIVRPSGTEPKIKVYLDTTGDTRADAESALSSLESDFRSLLGSLG